MRNVLFVSLCVVAASCGGETTPTQPTETPANLVSQVVNGNYVVFFRHAARDTPAISNDELLAVDRRGECVPGSELTAQGRDDAVAIGAAFKRLRIRLEHVYASPTCRTQQMAELAFGEHETTASLAWPEVWTEDEAPTLSDVLPHLLGDLLPVGTVRVLISHNGVLVPARMGLDITLEQSEAAIFQPHSDRGFEFVGTITKAEWLNAK